ncbi:MAG TPA: alkaline phosphatase family protein [Terriglobales bacterium]|jgi:phospholipase C|nr:alkaline phosphatase family protein [Terriglobales bacterium]
MATGLDQLKRIVVLMLENRSFDHMLGSLQAVDSRIDGISAGLSNPDTAGAQVQPQCARPGHPTWFLPGR